MFQIFVTLRLLAVWLFTDRRKGKLFRKFLRKKWFQRNPFLQILIYQNCIVDLNKCFLRRFRPKIFLKVNIFCQKFPFSKKNSFGAKSQHSLKLASCGFHKQTQRSFTKGVPIASLVIFFNVQNSSFFRRKLSTTPFRESPSSRRFSDFCVLLLCKSFCNLNYQKCCLRVSNLWYSLFVDCCNLYW